MVAVERGADGKFRNGVCIKRDEAPLTLPATIWIVRHEGISLERFCRDTARSGELETDLGTTLPIEACTWNGTFHSARPFTITLIARDGANVGDYVEFLRVYRNGDLMAAWNHASDSDHQQRVVITGESLVTGAFAVNQPPHLADMDLRIIPRSDSLTVGVDTQVRDDRAAFESNLSEAFSAAADAAVPADSVLRTAANCLRTSIETNARQIHAIVSGDAVASAPACIKQTDPDFPSWALADVYAEAKDHSRENLQVLRKEAYRRIDEARRKLLEDIPKKVVAQITQTVIQDATAPQKEAIDACKAEIVDRDHDQNCADKIVALDPSLKGKLDDVKKTLRLVDQDVIALLSTVDQARALADKLSDTAREIASNPDRQAQIYNAFAQSLSNRGDPFEPRRDNPPLLAGEQKIDLSYSDQFQFFVLAPWNGIPIQAKGGDAEVSAASAVPLVDVGGGRYQWAKSRFADLRVAAGIGFIQAEEKDTGTKRAGFLPHASVGIGTLKFGVGYLTDDRFGSGGDRVRLLVGIDLYKLISGNNVEAF